MSEKLKCHGKISLSETLISLNEIQNLTIWVEENIMYAIYRNVVYGCASDVPKNNKNINNSIKM